MTATTSELTFTPTPLTICFSVAVVLCAVVLGIITWRRSGYAAGVGWLELLRVLILVFVAISINQPEWREIFEPDEVPTLAVLTDVSASMDTADVVDPADRLSPALTRTAVAQRLAEDEGWGSLDEKIELLMETFSSSETQAKSATDLNGALDKLLEQQSSLKGVVLISDGDWNIGESPAQAATKLRMRDTPVFALPIGSRERLPDIELASFDVPTFAIVEKAVRLPFSISSSLPTDYSTTIEVVTDSGEKLSHEVTVPAMGKVSDHILWKPQDAGEIQLTLTVPLNGAERDDKNNSITAPMVIREESLKVLLIESFPRWEYRYLRNALERDPGVEVQCLLFHPSIKNLGAGRGYLEAFPEPDVLTQFDVIFLGDVGLSDLMLSSEQCTAMRDHVANQAAGMVFLPGFRGYQHQLMETELADLLPVVLDNAQPRGWGSATPGQFELTDIGLRSLLTRLEDSDGANSDVWSSLPGFQWFAGVARAKAGSEVLATHSSETNRYGRIPLIVTKTYGTGKILFMGTDGAWRWRKGVEDKYHYRFWGQVARWMAYQRNMTSGETMRLFYSPDRPQTGDILTLNANVFSIGGEPLRTAKVIVQAQAPSGKISSIRLQPGGEDQWGLFSASFTPEEPGTYQMLMTCAENGATLETPINVQGSVRERIGQPARYDVLEEIASISRGKIIEELDVGKIIAEIAALPEPEPIERRLRIWAHPAWIGVIILLLTIFWIGRKAVGAV